MDANVIAGPPKNSMTDLMKAFGTDDRPVKPVEFRTFWSSLTDIEKEYYKSAPLG